MTLVGANNNYCSQTILCNQITLVDKEKIQDHTINREKLQGLTATRVYGIGAKKLQHYTFKCVYGTSLMRKTSIHTYLIDDTLHLKVSDIAVRVPDSYVDTKNCILL